MEIVKFDKKYTEQILKIIIENLIEVNSKNYGIPASIHGCEFYHKL